MENDHSIKGFTNCSENIKVGNPHIIIIIGSRIDFTDIYFHTYMYKMLQKIYEERGEKPVNLFDFLLLLMEY